METCSQLTSQGHEAFAYVVDCSKREEVYQAAEKVKEEVGNVSVLVNNAGTMAGKSILEFDDEDIERTIGINLLAHFWVSQVCCGQGFFMIFFTKKRELMGVAG